MKKILRYPLILLAGIVIGFALLVFAFCIPGEWLVPQLKESHAVFEWEGMLPYAVTDLRVSRQDNFTDAWMLSIAGYNGEQNALQCAANAYHRVGKDDQGPYEDFLALYDPDEQQEPEMLTQSYARYWHGYSVLLRPLLAVFNYAQLRSLNTFLLCAEFAAAVWLMMRRSRTSVCVLPLMLTASMMIPQAVIVSMQFSSVIHITLLSLIALMLLWREGRSSGWQYGYMLMIGMATAYADFLTAPLMTLIIPLSTLMVLQDVSDGFLRQVGRFALLAAAWCAGYAGMWAGKWLIVWLVQGGEAFSSQVLGSISQRSSAGGLDNRLSVLLLRIQNCFEIPLNKMLAAVLMMLGIGSICRHPSCLRKSWPRLLCYAALAAVPVVWIFLLCNHSGIHQFSFRAMTTAFYALPVGLAACARTHL